MEQRSVKTILSRVVCFASSYSVVPYLGGGLLCEFVQCCCCMSCKPQTRASEWRVSKTGDPGIHVFVRSPRDLISRWRVWLESSARSWASRPCRQESLKGLCQPAQCSNGHYTDWLRHEPFDCATCVATLGLQSTESQPRKTRPACAWRQRPVR